MKLKLDIALFITLLCSSVIVYFTLAKDEVDIIFNYKSATCKVKTENDNYIYSKFNCEMECLDKRCPKSIKLNCENELKWSNQKDPDTCQPFCPEKHQKCCNNDKNYCNLNCPIEYYIIVLIYINKDEYTKNLIGTTKELQEYINVLNSKRCFYDESKKDLLLNQNTPTWKFILLFLLCYLTMVPLMNILCNCRKSSDSTDNINQDDHEEEILSESLLPSYGSIIIEDDQYNSVDPRFNIIGTSSSYRKGKQSSDKKGKKKVTHVTHDIDQGFDPGYEC